MGSATLQVPTIAIVLFHNRKERQLAKTHYHPIFQPVDHKISRMGDPTKGVRWHAILKIDTTFERSVKANCYYYGPTILEHSKNLPENTFLIIQMLSDRLRIHDIKEGAFISNTIIQDGGHFQRRIGAFGQKLPVARGNSTAELTALN